MRISFDEFDCHSEVTVIPEDGEVRLNLVQSPTVVCIGMDVSETEKLITQLQAAINKMPIVKAEGLVEVCNQLFAAHSTGSLQEQYAALSDLRIAVAKVEGKR